MRGVGVAKDGARGGCAVAAREAGARGEVEDVAARDGVRGAGERLGGQRGDGPGRAVCGRAAKSLQRGHQRAATKAVAVGDARGELATLRDVEEVVVLACGGEQRAKVCVHARARAKERAADEHARLHRHAAPRAEAATLPRRQRRGRHDAKHPARGLSKQPHARHQPRVPHCARAQGDARILGHIARLIEHQRHHRAELKEAPKPHARHQLAEHLMAHKVKALPVDAVLQHHRAVAIVVDQPHAHIQVPHSLRARDVQVLIDPAGHGAKLLRGEALLSLRCPQAKHSQRAHRDKADEVQRRALCALAASHSPEDEPRQHQQLCAHGALLVMAHRGAAPRAIDRVISWRHRLARVAHAVHVSILLVGVLHLGAVVQRVLHAVAVAVGLGGIARLQLVDLPVAVVIKPVAGLLAGLSGGALTAHAQRALLAHKDALGAAAPKPHITHLPKHGEVLVHLPVAVVILGVAELVVVWRARIHRAHQPGADLIAHQRAAVLAQPRALAARLTEHHKVLIHLPITVVVRAITALLAGQHHGGIAHHALRIRAADLHARAHARAHALLARLTQACEVLIGLHVAVVVERVTQLGGARVNGACVIIAVAGVWAQRGRGGQDVCVAVRVAIGITRLAPGPLRLTRRAVAHIQRAVRVLIAGVIGLTAHAQLVLAACPRPGHQASLGHHVAGLPKVCKALIHHAIAVVVAAVTHLR